MTDTLRWDVVGDAFEDGSRLADWELVEEGTVWHWQYDTHEITFNIYKHDGQFWKLYRVRYTNSQGHYQYDYGGQACRMTQVSYLRRASSPHSNRAMQAGDLEWIRTYEFDPAIHTVVKTGEENAKYGEGSGPRHAA